MKIGIQTFGSRGDINPWIALGQELERAGHEIIQYYTCYTGGDFSNYSTEKLKVISTSSLVNDKNVHEKYVHKKIYDLEVIELTNYMVKEVYNLFTEEIIVASETLCKEVDVMIISPNLYHAACIAEKYNIPRVNVLVEAQYSPNNTVSSYNDFHINNYFLEPINSFRKTLGIEPIKNVRTEIFNSKELNLLAYSRVFSTNENEWGNLFKLCGSFTLENDKNYELTDDLTTFLNEGPPPLFFSMGSLTFFEGENFDILEIFLKAIEMTGVRAIIQANWDEMLEKIPRSKNVYPIGYIPHEFILDKCQGIIHHGGAGTSHTSIIMECPSIVIAYAWDQFYFGRELYKLQSCSALLKRKYLDEYQLAGAINQLVSDPSFKKGVNDTKRKLKREKGIQKAVRELTSFLEYKSISV